MFAASVRPTGPEDEPNILERFTCGGVRVLRRVPARLVCDNLTTGVMRPDLYDPQITWPTASWQPFMDPDRPGAGGKPRDKPRSNARWPSIRDSLFAGRHFDSLPQMQDDALRWCTEIYGRHKHRGIDGQPPMSQFLAVEHEA